MTRANAHKLCFIAAALLFLGFFIKVAIDYGTYSSTLNSAPFYIWIIVDAVYFILPALIAVTAGVILKGKAAS